jgi:putative membrane protein
MNLAASGMKESAFDAARVFPHGFRKNIKRKMNADSGEERSLASRVQAWSFTRHVKLRNGQNGVLTVFSVKRYNDGRIGAAGRWLLRNGAAETARNGGRMTEWVLRFFKGAIIGTGFILPGVSGGALAAVFGLYERIVSFIAHITKNFLENVLFFVPVGLGALLGMFLLARPLSFFLENYETQVLWGFIGCIIGSLPLLWKEAGKKGRRKRHYVVLILTALIGFCLLYMIKNFLSAPLPLHFITWLFAGFLIALGVLVPGLSPSNFLVYLGMYKPMVDGFKTADVMTLLPIFLGLAVCLFSLSALMDMLFKKAYAGLFHFVAGIVLASTCMIVPVRYNYLSAGTVVCVAALFAGICLGFWMGKLEEKYKSA